MHVCFVMPRGVGLSPTAGAIATVCLELARGLVECGGQVTVICARASPVTYDVGRVIVVNTEAPVTVVSARRRRKLGWYHRHIQAALASIAGVSDQMSGAVGPLCGTGLPDAVLLMDYVQAARRVRASLPDARLYATLHGVYQRFSISAASFRPRVWTRPSMPCAGCAWKDTQ